MESMSDCIFYSSKYYKQAFSNAQRICEPLGYNFLSKKQESSLNKKQRGQLIQKVLFEKSVIKPLSIKKILKQKIQQYLLISDAKRKNTYLSANPLSIISKSNNEINQELQAKYFPSFSQSLKQTINLINSFHSISDEVMFNINDYALSNYLIGYDGSNLKSLKHIKNVFERQFIQYNVTLIKTGPKIPQSIQQKIQFVPFNHQDIKDKIKIDQFIFSINRKAKLIDSMYSGLHFFIGDCTAKVTTHDILKQEIQNLKYLQYYLYLLSGGILGNGQNALIKIRGTIRHKTVDFLFLFKIIFTKVTLIKPAYSNFLSSQKYMICEGYVAENGEEVHQYISKNFNLLAEYGEQKHLVNPQLIFKEQFLTDNTKNFNDSLIVKGLKQVLDVFLKNNNLEIYPSKSSFVQKLKSYDDDQFFKDVINQVEALVPNQEEIKNQEENQERNKKGLDREFNNASTNKPQVQEKQAQIDIFDFLKKAQQTKPIQKVKQKIKKPAVDEEQELQKNLQKRFKQQQRIKQEKKKQKKQKQKQKKQKQKRSEDQYNFTSHFDYQQG